MRRLSAPVPPKGLHWTVGHGVIAPRHSLRDKVTGRKAADAPEETAPAEEAAKKKRMKPPSLHLTVGFSTLCETAKLSGLEAREYGRSSLYRALNGAPPLQPAELIAELEAASPSKA